MTDSTKSEHRQTGYYRLFVDSKYYRRPGMSDEEFVKRFRFFPNVFHTRFPSTTERLAFQAIDTRRMAIK